MRSNSKDRKETLERKEETEEAKGERKRRITTRKKINDMPFALAVQVPNSPIFQPSMFGTASQQRGGGVQSPSSPSSSSGSSSLSASPTTPLLPFRVGKDQMTADSLLKKKRPAKLDIPLMTGFEGGFGLETCRAKERDEEKVVMEVEGDGYYSVLCKRGRRGYMEDRYSAFVDVHGDSTQAFFGVYDGHGGSKAADFASKNLAKNIMTQVSSVRCDEGIEMAVRNGYLTTDMEFLKQSVNGGTCCVTALITDGNLVVSNAGDCRAVISRGGVAQALTSDHQPSRLDEKDRIEVLGGYVDCYNGVWRIQGSLAVTRGIGDRHLKQWVIAEPETKILKIDPECEFLILASDGLWDKVSNQEAVEIVRPLCIGADKPDLFFACKKLSELAALRGSTDDISVMVIQLRRFLPWLII